MAGAITTAPLGGKKGGQKPTDRGKSGPKRRLLTDGGGIPSALAVDGAHRHDGKRARETIENRAGERPDATADAPPGLCRDTGYDSNEVRAWLEECGCTAQSRARGEEAQALKPEVGCKARRWVVARTPRWMNRFRRVLMRWDKKAGNELGFLHLVCAYITYRHAGLLG
jgi:putative transposase